MNTLWQQEHDRQLDVEYDGPHPYDGMNPEDAVRDLRERLEQAKQDMTPGAATRAAKRNLGGQKFGRLTIIGQIPGSKSLCLCDCGNSCEVPTWNVTHGTSRSCGCLLREARGSSSRKHGMTKTPEWRAWTQAINRCYNAHGRQYADYGGRGITVCDSWRASFSNFIADMGLRQGQEYSLGRIDNDGPYCPENCRWETPKQQARNRRSSRFIEAFGSIRTIAEWSELLGIGQSTIGVRLKRGLSSEQALACPK